MKPFFVFIAASFLLTGCIIFDKKSTAVTFHQFNLSTAVPTKTTPTIFIPRVQIPAAVRRPTLVINDIRGQTIIDDSQRWVYSLDRAVGDVIGHHLVQLTGLPYSTQAPSDTHLVLLIEVMQFGIDEDATILQLNYRIETSMGEALTQGQGIWRGKRAQSPQAFIDQQSSNLSLAAAEISQALLSILPKLSP